MRSYEQELTVLQVKIESKGFLSTIPFGRQQNTTWLSQKYLGHACDVYYCSTVPFRADRHCMILESGCVHARTAIRCVVTGHSLKRLFLAYH